MLGYAIAIAVAVPFWWVTQHLGYASAYDAATGPLTEFIVEPNGWSFVIALLAGIAGTLALTTAQVGDAGRECSSRSHGPRGGTIALCIGTGVWDEILPAFVQLVLNAGGIVLAGTRPCCCRSWYWHRMGGRPSCTGPDRAP